MKTLINLVEIVAVVCTTALLAGCSADDLLFNPEQVNDYVLPPTTIADSLLTHGTVTSNSQTIHYFHLRHTDTAAVAPHPVVLYHHDQYGNIVDYWSRVELLYQCGFDVVVYDYPGYGKSTGNTNSEQHVTTTAEAVYTHVVDGLEFDSSNVVHYGYGLGSVAALSVASITQNSKCVILESAYYNANALVQSSSVLNIPGSFVLDGSYENNKRIPNINTAVLLLHGTADTHTPLQHHGTPLYNDALQPKTLIKVEGAEANTIPLAMGTETYINIITAFVRGN